MLRLPEKILPAHEEFGKIADGFAQGRSLKADVPIAEI